VRGGASLRSAPPQGAAPHGSTPEELAQLATRERARYGEIIKLRNLHVD
jgi:hypothetical protein